MCHTSLEMSPATLECPLRSGREAGFGTAFALCAAFAEHSSGLGKAISCLTPEGPTVRPKWTLGWLATPEPRRVLSVVLWLVFQFGPDSAEPFEPLLYIWPPCNHNCDFCYNPGLVGPLT